MNNEDYEFQETLMSLGEYRTTALVLTYMRNHNTVKSSELEKETGMRQLEVSIAMRELIERGWITSKHEIRAGKRRPNILYKLASSMDKILDWYAVQADVKAAQQQQTVQKLKEMIKETAT